jgi:methionyl-tRNA formyltransferase
MGTPAFAVPTLAALARNTDVVGVVTRPDKRRGRGRKTAFSEVKEWALAAGLPVEQPPTLRDPEVQERLAGYRVDVIVVAAFGLILPPAVLEMPPMGCVNVHASLLPRHRGAAPIAWAILAGDDETGITTMQMDEGLDTGPMLLRRALPLRPDDTTASLTPRLAEIGAELLIETLRGLRDGTVVPEPQPAEGATLAPSFKKADGAIDWSAGAVAVDRQVRALQPWPGTFTFRDGERLALWRVRPIAAAAVDAAPGTVVAVGDDGIRVACGEGAIDILELQRPGGRRQPVAEFLHGRPVAVGERFTPDEG